VLEKGLGEWLGVTRWYEEASVAMGDHLDDGSAG
jgi:hypothetical protein